MELDLRHLMRIARRRGWIVILIMLVFGVTAFVVSSRQEPMYSATATLQVVPGQTGGSNEFSAVQASRSIAETYRLLIETGPVLDRVVEELNLPYGSVELEEIVSTSIIGETELIEVSAVSDDPEEAALIATTLVEQFQLHTQEQIDETIATARESLDTQIEDLEERRAEITTQIDDLESVADADDPAVQRQLDFLTEELSRIEQSLADIQIPALSINSGIVTNSAQVDVADPALVPTEPFEPRPVFTMLLGLFVGLLVGVGLVALIEFLDNTVKPEQNVQALVGAPVLATISQIAKLQPGGAQVYSMSQPKSSAAEAMRMLRTNLDFASASGEIETLVVTSPGPGEGKSTVTANLGVVMAQAGFKTVVIDADLRKPTQNRIFGVQNDRGLTTLLTHPEQSWQECGKKVALPGLLLISSGPVPPNPSDLVSSDRFKQLLGKIQEDADLILIDSPPILSASDSLAVAAHTDGMLLVCQSHKTRIDALGHAAHAVRQGGIRLVGVVINRQKGQQGASYYGEYYGTEAGARVSSPGD